MHIAEGFLPPSHALGWSLAAAPFVWQSCRVLTRTLRDPDGPRLALAASAAFTLALSALKLPSVAGSCSHPTGVGLGALLVGAACMPAIGTLVLLWQALLLAHGGFTTLGANVVAMAIVGPWVTVGVATVLRRVGLGAAVSVVAAVATGSLATYLTTALQLALAYPSAHGVGESFAKFAALFGITQVPLAIVEGLLAFAVLRTLAHNEVSPAAASWASQRVRS